MARWSSSDRVRFSHRLELVGIRIAVWWFNLLPDRAAIRAGAALGTLVYRIGVRRAVVLDNLARAEGVAPTPAATESIGRECYRNLGRVMAEYARMPRMDLDDLRRRVRIEGLEHLQAALAEGRGVIAITGHFGSIELMATSLRTVGMDPLVLVAPMKNPLARAYFEKHRRGYGVGVVEVGARMRSAIRHLRSGGLLCIAADQDAGRHGTFVEFLGRAASSPTGPVELALSTQAPVVFGLIEREADDRHRVTFRPPVTVTDRGDRDETLRHWSQLFADWLAEAVRRRPDHWWWLHRRWKTRPPGEDPPAGTG